MTAEIYIRTRLLHRFNQSFDTFANELPEFQRVLARKSGTFTGRSDKHFFRISIDTNPIYTCTPWLFSRLFEAINDDLFLDLALAGGLVSLASLLMDHLIDGQAEQPEEVATLRHTFLQHGVDLFHHHFPWKMPFWSHFRRLHGEHLRSLEIERDLQVHPKMLSLQEFEVMAGGKASPVVITTAALADKAECMKLLAPVERSLKLTCIAGQLHDDVLDWRPDMAENHLTYFLSQFLDGIHGSSCKLPEEAEILNRLDRNWQDVTQLEQAIDGYRQALAAVDGLDCPAWQALVNGYLSAAESQRKALIRDHVIRRLGQINEAEYKAALDQ